MRNAWERYDNILEAFGDTPIERITSDAKRRMVKTGIRNGSINEVEIGGKTQLVLLITTNTINKKTMCALPDESFNLGDYVLWNDSVWLVTQIEVDDKVYVRGVVERCNEILRWQNSKGDIIERWCVSDNMASNSEGIVPQKIIDMPKFVLEVKLPLDSETFELRRGRRFLIDIDHEDPNAYITTNRNIVTDVFDTSAQHGVNILVLSQTQRNNDKDNKELMIADYFIPEDPSTPGINCSIDYVVTPDIRVGGSKKKYTATFTNGDGDVIDLAHTWDVTILPEHEKYFVVEVLNGDLYVTAKYAKELVGTQIKIELSSNDGTASAELYPKVVSILDG